jgi:hypothetical protein
VGDPTHRAVVFAAVTLARRGLTECLAPAARGECAAALELANDWARSAQPLAVIRRVRAQIFETAATPVATTVAVIARVLEDGTPERPIDSHADRVVRRYVSLGAHLSVSSVVECLDSILDPSRALEVAKNTAAAIAYRTVGLGAARQLELRNSALEQAAWEEAQLGSAEHGAASLALQLFHEYLGVHWKNHADAQRLYLEQFLEWAFTP